MLYILLFIVGTIIGSFLHVVGTRLPANESIVKPGSHCEFCNHPLKYYDLFPIFSYLISGGKCRYCKKKLPLSYLLIEFLTGVLFSYNFRIFGLSYEFLIAIIITCILITIYVSDFKYFIILDSPLLIGGILIFTIQSIAYGINYSLIHLATGLGMFVIIYLIKLLGDKIFKRESLGGGDIKLCFIIGQCVGFKLGLISIVLACFLTFPYALYISLSNNQKEIPFGPFLCISLYIIFIFLDKFSKIIEFIFSI